MKSQSLLGRDKHVLVIVEDLANKFYSSPSMANLFANTSNHDKLSFIVATQNAFPKGVHRRDIAVNITTYCILRNCSDQLSLGTLSRHLTSKQNFFGEIMRWLESNIAERRDRYLIVNCHNDSTLHVSFKCYTGLFPTITSHGKVEEARPIFFNIE